ncbi:MAG: D-aminoacyl-tRNA deacylase [bacterium]
MRLVIQRVKLSYVRVGNTEISRISRGINILVGFCKEDYPSVIDSYGKLVEKVINLRIFEDEKGKMNLSLIDIDGEILLVSQFTLYGDLSRGRRPSFDKSLDFDKASFLFDNLEKEFRKKWNKVKIGAFGEHMEVGIINDGPVTFILDW